jgi:SAM-dependent methyltransferase
VSLASASDLARLDEHRAIYGARPELRAIYEGWFRRLLDASGDRSPIVELGSGPGFFKAFRSDLIATDVHVRPWIDVAADATMLPFASGTVGALVMVDVLHHLARPLAFLTEAARVLKPGGRVVMIEPWITPFSFVIYRWFHHEDCVLGVNLDDAFSGGKQAFDGNAAIPYRVVQASRRNPGPLVLRRAERFLGLSYLMSLGFKRARPLPAKAIALGAGLERLLGPIAAWNATRILCVWEKA